MKNKTDISKLEISELISLYEASSIVFEFYDNEAMANQNEYKALYEKAKVKRDTIFKNNQNIITELEKRLDSINYEG